MKDLRVLKYFKQTTSLLRIIRGVCLIFFVLNNIIPAGFAQAQTDIPALSPSSPQLTSLSLPYSPAIVKGLSIYPDNPFKFDFIIDTGDEKLSGNDLKNESEKLIKYFLAALTVPEKEMWVNLSPYEKDRIIPKSLGQTQMGIDMLSQDYLLKRITASLIYPESNLGKKFWSRVYKQAYQRFGRTDVPINTFNKVWIAPDNAVVYEKGNSVFVAQRHLRVLLEEDYLALGKSKIKQHGNMGKKIDCEIQSSLIRDIILPEIEKEINTGKNFAELRQVYNCLILASWYKKKLHDSILGQIYVDSNKIKGIKAKDITKNKQIYEQYLKTFKKGVFNLIKEEYDPFSGMTIPRKYFSGGLTVGSASVKDLVVLKDAAQLSPGMLDFIIQPVGQDQKVTWQVIKNTSDQDKIPDKRRTAHVFDLSKLMVNLVPLHRVPGEKRIIELEGSKGNIEMELSEFNDKEIHTILLNPENVKDADILLAHSIDTADDVWQAILIMDHLRQYGVGTIHLIIKGQKFMGLEEGEVDGDSNLITALSLFADQISFIDKKNQIRKVENIIPFPAITKRVIPLQIHRLLYLNHQFRSSAEEALKMLSTRASAENITVENRNGIRFMVLPNDLTGKNVVVYHSMESSEQIVNLILALIGLRQQKVNSISLVNAYLGYARQDKISLKGEGLAATTVLRIINRLVDYHFVINAHYGKKTGQVQLQGMEGTEIYNLNGFIPMAEFMVDEIVKKVSGVNLEALSGDEAKTEIIKLGPQIENEFNEHPVLIVGPDKGSKLYSQEAATELKRYINKTYGANIPVYVGYIKKERDPRTGEIKRDASPMILDIDSDQPLNKLGNNRSIKEAWAFILDDMTDTGGTLLSATYVLVKEIGLQWRRVFAGVVHGVLSEKLGPFKTGLTDLQIKDANAETLPSFINDKNGRMPPILLVAMKTMLLPKERITFRHVPTSNLISHVIKHIIEEGLSIQGRNHEAKDSMLNNAAGKATNDQAMSGYKKGGIDFDTALMDLQIKHDGRNSTSPTYQRSVLMGKIEGLTPVIINIVPVDLEEMLK